MAVATVTTSTQERQGAVKFKGSPLTLLGPEMKVGAAAPEFHVVDQALSPVSWSSLKGNAWLVSVVPSLDTPICDMQTRRFNQEAAKLGNIGVLTVSMDLPFAQKRWCGAAGIDKVKVVSDYQDASFGKAYGVLIKELRLLIRAIFLVDRNGTVRYVEYVPEVTSHPNYDAALAAAGQLYTTS